LGYTQFHFERIQLDAQHQHIGPRPLMPKAMRMMTVPTPAVAAGLQQVRVTRRLSAGLLR